MTDPTFKNKTILLTGSSSGIGLSTAHILLSSGAKVFGVDITPPPPGLSSNPSYHHHTANLLDRTSASSAVKACLATYGDRIDALLNVAGISDHMSSVDTLTDEDWDRVIAINLTAPVLLMRETVQQMLRQSPPGGAIVNVASTAASSGGVAGVAYTSSKHGLLGASRNVAYRFKKENIRCNVVSPGGTATNIGASMQQGKMDLEAMKVYAGALAARGVDVRTGEGVLEASQVARCIVFLAGEGASGVSGAEVAVDAGGCAV